MNMNAQRLGCLQSRVLELLGEVRRATVYSLDHTILDFGEHWFWTGATTAYTPAGLRRMADGFAEVNDTPAALALRAEAERIQQVRSRCDQVIDRRKLQYKDDDAE